MKSKLFVVMALLGAILSVMPAHAQSGVRESVSIPFDFSVGGSSLKAGMYTVAEDRSGILTLTSIDGRQGIFALTVRDDAENASRHPHLVFMRYGSETFFDKIYLSADSDFYRVPLSKRERQVSNQHGVAEESSLLLEPAR